jgi:hypothetical protein
VISGQILEGNSNFMSISGQILEIQISANSVLFSEQTFDGHSYSMSFFFGGILTEI